MAHDVTGPPIAAARPKADRTTSAAAIDRRLLIGKVLGHFAE